MLYLSQDMPLIAIFLHTWSSGCAVSSILYFELLLSCIIVYTASNNTGPVLTESSLAKTKLSDGFFRMMRHVNKCQLIKNRQQM